MAGKRPRHRWWQRFGQRFGQRARRRFGPRSLLVRRTDVVEDVAAWLLATLALLAVVAAVLVGRAAHDAELGPDGVGGWTPVHAEVLADAPDIPDTPTMAQPTTQPTTRLIPEVPVSWTAPDGTEQAAELAVRAPLRAGTTIPAWVDRDGHITTSPPLRGSQAVAFGVGAGLTVAASAWALLALAWSGVCRLTARRNDTAWTREWARVEPEWRRRVR